MATTKARIHPQFLAVLNSLVVANRETFATVQAQGGGRRWCVPPTGDWSGDVADLEGIAHAFSRQEIETNMAEVYQDPEDLGGTGDVISLKLQSDYLACAERAFRARHASSARCVAMHLARRKAHGHADSIFHAAVLKQAQDAILAGQQSVTTAEPT